MCGGREGGGGGGGGGGIVTKCHAHGGCLGWV